MSAPSPKDIVMPQCPKEPHKGILHPIRGVEAQFLILLLLLGLFVLLPFSVDLIPISSEPPELFSQTYGGIEADDHAFALIQTSDGGFAFAGSTWSFGAGNNDMWLVKTDAKGIALWNQTIGGTEKDWARTLIQTTDGGFALAGVTLSYGAGNGDMWLVKTDASGIVQWDKTYGGPESEEAYALVQTTDGGFALTGYTSSHGAGNNDMWLVRTDANGGVRWDQTYGGTGDERAFDFVRNTDGGFTLAGET